MADLSDLRKKIDEIDQAIVRLLGQRASLVLEVKAAKQESHIAIYSPERERQILNRVVELASGSNFPVPALERIFTAIVSATRSLMGELKISYLGPESSFSHDAALKQFGEAVTYNPAMLLEDVFRRVEQGEVHYGVVPIESTSAGLSRSTFEAFLDFSVEIAAEISLPKRLVLASKSELSLSDVRVVYADAQSLAGALSWVRTNLPRATVAVEDGASHVVQKLEQDSTAAAVLSLSAAERFGLKAIATGVEDEIGAEGRFIVVGRKSPLASGRDKTSILCAVKDRAGALVDILAPFARHNLTLTKIESKPVRNRVWEYVFFIDVVGHRTDPEVKAALEELEQLSSHYKFLGSYPMVCQ